MNDFSSEWRSPDGVQNAIALRAQYADGFEAIAEFDRIGHLLLFRVGSAGPAQGLEALVGLALLRRAVTMFTGLRSLFEASCTDPAKLIARASFELLLQYRCFAYGSTETPSLETETSAAEREPRAARYYVFAERRGLRTRALILRANSPYPPDSDAGREALENELLGEIEWLRTKYPQEWAHFGDVTADTVVRHVGGRDEPPWFSMEFLPAKVNSLSGLAKAFGHEWEYDFLYDSLSSHGHVRGLAQDATIEGSQFHIHHPHNTDWFQMLAYWCVGWHMQVLVTAAKCYAPQMIEQLQTLGRRHAAGIETLRPRDVPNMLA